MLPLEIEKCDLSYNIFNEISFFELIFRVFIFKSFSLL